MSSHNSNAISPSSLPLKLSMGRRTDRPDVETEYADLQRQYRIVESEKKAYTEKTQTQLKKLEAMVEKLQEDNVTLRQEIKNLDQRRQSFQNNTISPKVAELSEKISTYGEKVDSESSRLQDLENEIVSLQQKIKSQQDLLGGIGLTQIEQQTNGYIKTLENRLQTVLSKHSETVAQTKKIRHDIESKKREKQVFDGLAKKREKDIIDRKKRMSKIVEESNYAYEARDDLQNKMFSIRERMVKETADHEDQLIEMGKLIEQEELRRSEIERVIMALVGSGERGTTATADTSEFQKSIKGAGGTSKTKTGTSSAAPSIAEQLLPDDDIQVLSIDEQIKKFEDFFTRLSPLVGDVADPIDIVDKIIGNEFQNFSRFNFINETHKQCDMLEASIHTLKEELEQSKKASDTGGDKIRKKLLEGLQQQLEDTEKKTEKFENKAAQCLKVFSVKEGIHDILDTLGDFRTRDLSINELNETNIWRILATISMALSPYLSGYIHSHSKEGMDVDDSHAQNSGVLLNKTNALLGLSEGVIEDLMAQSSLVQIDPPTTGYDSTDPEDQVYPFSSEEMRLKLTGAWTGSGRDTATPSRRHRSSKMASLKGGSRPSTSTSALSVA